MLYACVEPPIAPFCIYRWGIWLAVAHNSICATCLFAEPFVYTVHSKFGWVAGVTLWISVYIFNYMHGGWLSSVQKVRSNIVDDICKMC